MGPHPAVAAIRLAVRHVLHDVLTEYATAHVSPTAAAPPPATAPLPAPASPAAPAASTAAVPAPAARPRSAADTPGHGIPPAPAAAPLVLVACSGGADSMALASALSFEAPRQGARAGGITIDHGLQNGSDLRAQEVVGRLRALGLDPVESVRVDVGRGGGPEAAARDARYAALDDAAQRLGAAAVLLGHTRDDQAETVLLALARGSGVRSLSGMAAASGPGGRYRRPFLQIDRQVARKACMVQSLPVWDDPHNVDPAYTRSRVRHEALPVLEKALGRGVVASLARTARLSRDDADALDAWAADAACGVRDAEGRLDVRGLYALPPAVRRRILRRAALDAGSPAGSLFSRHVEEMDKLITGWRGQGAINLPGRVSARREQGRLVVRREG
ncbi:tRNA lysidine(34) synthetase TilS [Streptomyces sp. 184]|uniref:tRNA lysidine(34) synthetase TilS n=1 Tax=Streptomyces sp. 184 TaxID=1827526 RepID=UPI0038914F5B